MGIMDGWKQATGTKEQGDALKQFDPESIPLADDKPLWYALLDDSDVSVPVPDEGKIQNAKAWLRALPSSYREQLVACSGKSLDEARQRLGQIGKEQAARSVS